MKSDIHGITDLRRMWPVLDFDCEYWPRRYIHYVAVVKGDWELLAESKESTAAAAAQSLAERLAEAGYPPKEKP